MKAYSEDLRRKIVDVIERGMPKAEAARTFGIGISTVKRYATKAQRGEPLEPGKAPGKRPKIDERVGKLLAEDLKEHPFATLREHCEYVEAVSGVSVSRSTMCRSIARISPTHKKGAKRHGARRVPKGDLAVDGGRGGRPLSAGFRGRDGSTYLACAPLRLRPEG